MAKTITAKAELLGAVSQAVNASGLTVRDIGAQAGVSKSHVQRVSTGDPSASVSLESLMRLADLFGLAYRFEGKPVRAQKKRLTETGTRPKIGT